jgi:hypothetical protein
MANREIKFPCPVRRMNVTWRDGNWTVEKEARIESMTLPKSDDLPEEAKKRGVAGFWYEAVDAEGRTIYRQQMMDPFMSGVEVFDEDGTIRRKHETPHEITLKIFVPDVPELAELHIYSSSSPSEHEQKRSQGPAERIAAIDLRGGRGGNYGCE